MRAGRVLIALLSVLFAAFHSGAWAAAPGGGKPKLLGSSKDWHAYQTGTGANRLCYVLSEPKEMNPKNVKRDSVYFLISTWPGRKVKNEPSVVPGYKYKDGSKVQVDMGSDKFELFSMNDGDAGGAWMEDPADEKKMIDAMKRGKEIKVTGTSSRGTLTRDNYSLAGISAALDMIDKSCK